MTANKRKKIGLALGGGGAKGLAHIGVLKVLEKNSIPIDYIAGSSIGAVIGAYYAASKSVDYVEKIALSSDINTFASLMIELTNRGGFVEGNKILNYFEKTLDGIDFSELQIPLAIVATELNSGKEYYFEKSGDVASAIRASISYPPVFAPFKIKNKMFVDGGLSCLVPVEKVRQMGADIVIAVDVERDYVFNKKDFEQSALRNTYKVFRVSIKVLLRKVGQYDTQNADIVITPPVGKFRTWMDFDKAKKLIKIGEESALKSLKEIKSLI